MLEINDELLSALSTVRELVEEVRSESTCNVKQVGAAALVPYAGRKVPTIAIKGKSYGVFLGVNRYVQHNCIAKGPMYCPADRLNPNKVIHDNLVSFLRRLRCVNKFCAEVQALKKVLRVVRHPQDAILLSSEVPCDRCVDWIIHHPFVRVLVFERLNEGAGGGSPFAAASVYELVDLRVHASVDAYQSVVEDNKIISLKRSRYYNSPVAYGTWNWNRPLFPENGSWPVSDSKELLDQYWFFDQYFRMRAILSENRPRETVGEWGCTICNSNGDLRFRGLIDVEALNELLQQSHKTASPNCANTRITYRLPTDAEPVLQIIIP